MSGVVWASVPSWIWLGGTALGLSVQGAAWGACLAATLVLLRGQSGDDLLWGINLNFLAYVPMVQLVFLIDPQAGEVLLAHSQASVLVFVMFALLWRMARAAGPERLRRAVLAAGAAVAALWLLNRANASAADLALVLGMLFAAERLWLRGALIGAGAVAALPTRVE